jgi:hypothetical protein
MKWIEDRTPPRTMPATVREPFEVLWQEVVRLHYLWHVFGQLYREKRTVELLNAQAEGFFGLNQRIWIDAILLGLARVLDDTKGSVSLRVLVKRMASSGPHDLVDDLERRLTDLVKISDEMVDAHRNARLAHLDAKYHPSGGKETLPELKVANFERLFDRIAELMNVVGVGTGHGWTVYEAPASLSDGDTLIFALRKADRYDEIFGFHSDDELDKGRFGDLSRTNRRRG